MMAYTLLIARLIGRPVPSPRYSPNLRNLVEFLADTAGRGAPAQVMGFPSDWVRICLLA
jgi:hypothetical protein